MSIDKQQKPWWDDAQDYRNGTLSGNRRRLSERSREDVPQGSFSDHELSVARRRRAAQARADAQERRRRVSSGPVDFGWAQDSPFWASSPEEIARRQEKAREREVRRKTTDSQHSVQRRPGVQGQSARRQTAKRRPAHKVHPVARPERLLLYAAILGIFLVLAAASNSGAAVMLPGH